MFCFLTSEVVKAQDIKKELSTPVILLDLTFEQPLFEFKYGQRKATATFGS